MITESGYGPHCQGTTSSG